MQINELLAINKAHLSLILNHDFYRKLRNGELTHRQLGIYLAQDNLYLSCVAQGLILLARTVRNDAAVRIFRRHAREARALIAQQLAIISKTLRLPSLHNEQPRPTTYAYTNHVFRCAAQGVAEGTASLVPCYYFYCQAVSRLKEGSSREQVFARWIHSLPSNELNAIWMQELSEVLESATKARKHSIELERIAFISGSYEVSFLNMVLDNEGWS